MRDPDSTFGKEAAKAFLLIVLIVIVVALALGAAANSNIAQLDSQDKMEQGR